MKPRYTTAAAGLVLGAAIGLPAAASAEQHASGGMQGGGEQATGTSAKEMQSGGQGGSSKAPGESGAMAHQQKGVMRSVANLQGSPVVNNAGDEIGEIYKIVRSDADDDIHAVVSVGGFLGIGDKEVTIPLKDLRLQDDRLLAPIASTEDELAARRAYEPTGFSEVTGEQMVEVGAAAMAMQQEQGGMPDSPAMAGGTSDTSPPMPSGIGFGTLDLNRDDHLSKDEAAARPELVDHWKRADTDNDGLIDRAEFSAFEVQSAADKAETGAKPEGGQPGMGESRGN